VNRALSEIAACTARLAFLDDLDEATADLAEIDSTHAPDPIRAPASVD
jgi:hypothetical protein